MAPSILLLRWFGNVEGLMTYLHASLLSSLPVSPKPSRMGCCSQSLLTCRRHLDGSLVENRPLAAVRRDYRHARKRSARLSQHALEWTPVERPLRPPSASGICSILVYHPSHTLLARLVSHRLT